eukprot:41496_1
MADDEKQEIKNDDNNVRKCYKDIQFSKVEDKFDVIVQYDSNSESLSLHFINQTTKSVFKHQFTNEDIKTITSKYNLKTQLLLKMIMDSLASNERTAQNLRIFILPTLKQATDKSKQIQSLDGVPEAITIPTGFIPINNTNDNANNQMENCLLFVLHFSAPPIIYLNYCFIIKEKDVSDYDKLSMRFDDLQRENVTLKTTVQTQKEQMDELSRANNELTQRVQQLEAKFDNNEQKLEEIELNLQNNWKRQSTSFSAPKAIKIGHCVYVQGLIDGGTSGIIATLPEGWRPTEHKMFVQRSNGANTRVDVQSNGNIVQQSTWTTWLSLEGISFVVR